MRVFLVAAGMFAAATTPVPDVLHRIAKCETGGNYQHSTRDFISAFGIRRSSWNGYRPEWVPAVASRKRKGERLPSRVEQVAVARAIAERAGLSAWECWRLHGGVRHG